MSLLIKGGTVVTRAHHGNMAASAGGPLEGVAIELHVIGSVTLEQSNQYRLALGVVVTHAAAFAKDFRGAHPGAAAAEDIGFQNGFCCAINVVVTDLADEAGNVDVRRAGLDAGRVIAVQAALAFDDGLARRQRRMQVAEVACQRRWVVGADLFCAGQMIK